MADDPLRQYTEEEDRQLAVQLDGLTRAIQRGEWRDIPLNLRLLTEMHRILFSGVRSHAGRVRSPGTGSQYLNFGPNRSVQHSEVARQLQDVMTHAVRALNSFIANPDASDYELKALELAVWVHAEVVRIHPFEDGNGRTSRCLLNWVLVRLSLRPIAAEIVKIEYNNALNHYFATGNRRALTDLFIRIYTDAMDDPSSSDL